MLRAVTMPSNFRINTPKKKRLRPPCINSVDDKPLVNASSHHPPDTSTASALLMTASDMTGMEQVDRQRVDAIILREWGNSLYMQQQRKRDAKVNEKIQQLEQKLSESSEQEWKARWEAWFDQQVTPRWLAQRPKRSTIIVLDMDMLYMACEMLEQAHLANIPACVVHGRVTTLPGNTEYTGRYWDTSEAHSSTN